MRLRKALAHRDDRGVTLIELLMVVVLLAVIIVPLAGALITFFRNTDATNDRLAASHDAQIAANYFAKDVQSIGLRDWSAPPYGLLPSVTTNGQLGSTTCGPNAVLLRLAWDEPTVATGEPPETVVVYTIDDSVAGERQLRRMRCSNGVVKDDIVVAHHLVGTPTVTCYDAAGNALGSCTGVPHSIQMPIDVRVEGNPSNTLRVNLFGQRRQTS